jgi:hypothetical protein
MYRAHGHTSARRRVACQRTALLRERPRGSQLYGSRVSQHSQDCCCCYYGGPWEQIQCLPVCRSLGSPWTGRTRTNPSTSASWWRVFVHRS